MRYYLDSQYSRVRSRTSLKKRPAPRDSFRKLSEREVIPKSEFWIEPQREVRPKRELRIEPMVRNLYDSWLENYHRSKLEGSKRHLLPIGALQRYIQSRRAAFEMKTGADPTHFNDALDKIDTSVAVDSFAQLDSELDKNHLYFEKEGPPSMEKVESRQTFHRASTPEQAKEAYERYLEEIRQNPY